MPKDLIIVFAGKRSLHHAWVDGNEPRNWDLLVCPYEEIPPPPENVMLSDVVAAQAKYLGLKVLLKEWSGWQAYRYVMLADEDVLATQETWSRFFDRCVQFGAKLAQPAVLESSYFSHSVTVRNTEFVARRVSFVETKMPCFRSDVLADMITTFDLSESGEGWGIDLLWSKKLGYNDVFVIDDTPALHTRPDKALGDPDLRARLNAELTAIMQGNQLPWVLKTFAGIPSNGEEIAEGNASFLYRLFRGYQRLFDREPQRFTEMIRLQLAQKPAT